MQRNLPFLFILLSLCAVVCPAQLNERDMKKEEKIWQQLEKVAPKSVETFKQATTAMDNGDAEKAVQLYEEVFKKAPDFDPVMRRLGMMLVQVGRVNEGMGLLEMAVEKKRSPENLISLAQYLTLPVDNAAQPSRANLERSLALAKEAYQKKIETDDESYLAIIAQLALELDREKDFREAAKNLKKEYPNTMTTHYFSAIVAAMDEHWMEAEDEIKKAQSLGLPAEAVNKFLESGVHSRASVWRYAYLAAVLVVIWAVGLLLLYLLGKGMSRKTLNWIENSDPNSTTSQDQVSLRKIYKSLINFAGFYYYISLPVILFLVVAVAASVLYGVFMVGQIPIKLVVFVVIGALVTIFTMIRSLFIRVHSEDPGRPLKPEEAPALWALTRQVADTLGTRPIDEIRITPGTEMAVYENGSFRERMQDRARRILILGVGNLNDFKANSFRAVLAHEYGHFTHRDTAGGDVAIRVNSDMMKFAIEMAKRGQAVYWNIAFQFLRLYHFIFRRISHGATRLQEVLADRVAVKNYGADAFESGLRHVIRRGIELEEVAYWELHGAQKQNRVMQNLYELTVPESDKDRIEDKIEAAIKRPTSEDDTHPAPAERFRLARKITCNHAVADAGMVWDLFTDRQALTHEMSDLIARRARGASY
ncbi:MAG: tetratricopeptide repeat protein [Acidobacteriota bacterium]